MDYYLLVGLDSEQGARQHSSLPSLVSVISKINGQSLYKIQKKKDSSNVKRKSL